MSQALGTVGQIAYIVENIEEAIENWGRFAKGGPFFIMENFEIIDPQYRGAPMANVNIRLALGYSDGLCVEFIEQRDDAPSVYTEVFARKGYCFHHWAYMTTNFDEEVKKHLDQGLEICFSGAAAVGGRFVYLDSTDLIHSMVEIIEFTPPVSAFFATIEEASQDWDGKNPLRYL